MALNGNIVRQTNLSGTIVRASGGGVSDYDALTNRPQINGVTLTGDLSSSDLSLADAADIPAPASSGTPAMDGTASRGTSTDYARKDHVHPKDTSKLSLSGGTMTGALAMGSHKITGLADGTANTDAVNKQQMETAISNLGEVLDFKGTVQNVADLPATGNRGGDVYYVRSLGAMFAWVETAAGGAYEWDEMGEHVDMSAYIEAPTATANQILYFNGSAWAAKAQIPEVTNSTAGAVSVALDPEKIYHFTGALTSLTLTLTSPASGQLAHYHFDFDSGSTAPTLTLPNTVTMPGGFTVEANKHYEIDILNNYGAVMAW